MSADKAGKAGEQLAAMLARMYHRGLETGEGVAMVHLFGIKYADEIHSTGATAKMIVELSGIPASFATEVSKGIKLSKYVKARHQS